MQAQVDAGRVRVLRSRPAPPPARMFFCYHASDSGSNVAAVLRAVRAVIGKLPVVEAG
jgi:hypothetical protein